MSLYDHIKQKRYYLIQICGALLCFVILLCAFGLPGSSSYVNCTTMRSHLLPDAKRQVTSLYGIWSKGAEQYSVLHIKNFDLRRAQVAQVFLTSSNGTPLAQCLIEVAPGESIRKPIAEITSLGRARSGSIRLDRNAFTLQGQMDTSVSKSDAPLSTGAFYSHHLLKADNKATYTTFNKLLTYKENRTLSLTNVEEAVKRRFYVQRLSAGNVTSTTTHDLSPFQTLHLSFHAAENQEIEALKVIPGEVLEIFLDNDTSFNGDNSSESGEYAQSESGSGSRIEEDSLSIAPTPVASEPAYRAFLMRENTSDAPTAATLVSFDEGIASGTFSLPMTPETNTSIIHIVELFNTHHRALQYVSLNAHKADGTVVALSEAGMFCLTTPDEDGVFTIPAHTALYCFRGPSSLHLSHISGQTVSSLPVSRSLTGQVMHYATLTQDSNWPVTALAHSQIRKFTSGDAFHLSSFYPLNSVELSHWLPIPTNYLFGNARSPQTLAFSPKSSQLFAYQDAPLNGIFPIEVPTGLLGTRFLSEEDSDVIELLDSSPATRAYPEGILATAEDPLDLNNDGLINDQDVAILEAAMTSGKSPADGEFYSSMDLDGDGDIDYDDLTAYISENATRDGSLVDESNPKPSPVASASPDASASPSPTAATDVLALLSKEVISIEPNAPPAIYPGDTIELSITANMANGLSRQVTDNVAWSILGDAAVIHSSSLSATTPGTVLLQASYAGISANIALTISKSEEIVSTEYLSTSYDPADVNGSCEHPAEYYSTYQKSVSSGNGLTPMLVVKRPLTTFVEYNREVEDEKWNVPLPHIEPTEVLPKMAATKLIDTHISKSRNTLWMALHYSPIQSVEQNEHYGEYYKLGVSKDTWGEYEPNPELNLPYTNTASDAYFCGFAKIDITNPSQPQFMEQYVIPSCGTFSYPSTTVHKPYSRVSFELEDGVFGLDQSYFYADDDGVYALGGTVTSTNASSCQEAVGPKTNNSAVCNKYNRVLYTAVHSGWKSTLLEPAMYRWHVQGGFSSAATAYPFVGFSSSPTGGFTSSINENTPYGWSVMKIDRDTFPYVFLGRVTAKKIDNASSTLDVDGNCGGRVLSYTHEYGLGKVTGTELKVVKTFKKFSYRSPSSYKAYKCDYKSIKVTDVECVQEDEHGFGCLKYGGNSEPNDDPTKLCGHCSCPSTIFGFGSTEYAGENIEYDHYPGLGGGYSQHSIFSPVLSGASVPIISPFSIKDFDHVGNVPSFIFSEKPGFELTVEVEYAGGEQCSLRNAPDEKTIGSLKTTITLDEALPNGTEEINCSAIYGEPVICNGEPIDLIFTKLGENANPVFYHLHIDQTIGQIVGKVVPNLTYLSTEIEGATIHTTDSEVAKIDRLIPLRQGGHAAVTNETSLQFYNSTGQKLGVEKEIAPLHRTFRARIYSTDYGIITSPSITFQSKFAWPTSQSPVLKYSAQGYSDPLSPENYLCGFITDRDLSYQVPYATEYPFSYKPEWRLNTSKEPYWSRRCYRKATGGLGGGGFGQTIHDRDFYFMSIETRKSAQTSGSNRDHHTYIKGNCEGQTCYVGN